MRRIVKFVAPLVVLLAAATTAAAVADPVTPTDPYPRVDDPGTGVCAKETRAVDRLLVQDAAKRRPYERAKDAFDRGVGSPEDVAGARRPLLEYLRDLSRAKYALAACRTKEGAGAAKDKKCAALYLEYNRLVDELAINTELDNDAKESLARARRAGNLGVGAQQALDAAEAVAALTDFDRKATEQDLAAALKAIKDDADCKDGSYQRPQVAPPPREVVPTSAPADPPVELSPAPFEGSAQFSVTLTPVP